MKVLLTGAAGFIGSHTAEALVADGHQVVGIDCFDSYLYTAEAKRKNAAELAHSLRQEPFRLVELDICDQEGLDSLVADQGFDVVLHLAALAGVRPSLREPQRYARANVQGTISVFEACRKHGIERCVYASSSSVYGAKHSDLPRDQVVAFSEDDLCLTPASPYAATKRSCELIASTYRDLYGLGVSGLRYFTVYGPRQRPDMAIHHFTARIAAGQPITVYGDGSSFRDYTFVSDAVAGTVAACQRLEAGQYNIYNIGGTATTTLSELVALIETTVGKEAIVERKPDQPGDVPMTFANVSRAQRDLGYAPTTPVADGLPRFWDWYKRVALGSP